MKRLVLALAAMLGGFVNTSADAAITLNLSANVGSEIRFVGNGTGATISFTPGPINTNSFVITSLSGGSGTNAGLGLKGDISGTFSYTLASIVSSGGGAEAATVVGDGTNKFTIIDNAGVPQTFSADISGINITTSGTSGALNYKGAVNLTNISYSGTNADLLLLKQQASSPNGGIATITFQFVPDGKSLTQLVGSIGSTLTSSTSFSGSVTAVPEPGSVVLAFSGIAMLGLGCYRKQRLNRA